MFWLQGKVSYTFGYKARLNKSDKWDCISGKQNHHRACSSSIIAPLNKCQRFWATATWRLHLLIGPKQCSKFLIARSLFCFCLLKEIPPAPIHATDSSLMSCNRDKEAQAARGQECKEKHKHTQKACAHTTQWVSTMLCHNAAVGWLDSRAFLSHVSSITSKRGQITSSSQPLHIHCHLLSTYIERDQIVSNAVMHMILCYQLLIEFLHGSLLVLSYYTEYYWVSILLVGMWVFAS